MNKTQLIDALAARVGDRRTAANAVDGLLSTIVETVKAGESVSLTGFGVFEPRARAARVGRNPRTGETVAVPAATVPAFRPGTGFRTAVTGDVPAAVAQAAPVEVAAPAKPTKAKAAPKAKPAAKSATKPKVASSAKAAPKSAKSAKTETAKSKKKAKK